MSQTIYITYLLQDQEVTPLAQCSGYRDAEKQMSQHIGNYMLVNYPGEPRKTFTAKEFDERVVRKDTEFKEGVVFVRDKHETSIYRKTAIAGNVYGHTFRIYYLGKISVVECPIVDNSIGLITQLTQRISELQPLATDAKMYKERAESYSQSVCRMDAEMERMQTENSKLRAHNDELQMELISTKKKITEFKDAVMEGIRDAAASNATFKAPPKRGHTHKEKKLQAASTPVQSENMSWFSGGKEPKHTTPKK